MEKTTPHILTSWQSVLIVLVANAIPLAFIYIPPDFLFTGSFEVTIISEYIKFSVYLVGITLIIALTILEWLKQRVLIFPSRLVIIPCVLFYLAFVISFWYVTDVSFAWVVGIEVYLLPVLLLLVLSTQRITDRQYFILSLGLCIAPFVTSIIGLAQEMNWWTWAGMLPKDDSASLFFNVNLAGEFVVLFIPLLAGVILGIQRKTYQIGLFCILLAILLYLVITTARGAWVGLISSISVTFIFAMGSLFSLGKNKITRHLKSRSRLHLKIWIYFAIVPLFIFLIYTSSLWMSSLTLNITQTWPSQENSSRYIQEFEKIKMVSSNGRLEIWKDSLNLLKQHLWTGIGSGHFKLVFPLFIESYEPFIKMPYGKPIESYFLYPYRTHNDYLQVWIELGIFGIIALVTLFSVISWRAWAGLRWMLDTGQSKRYLFMLGAFGGFVAWAVTMFFEFPFRMPATLFNGWLLSAIVVSLSYQERKKSVWQLPLLPWHFIMLAIISCCIILTGVLLGKAVFTGALYQTQGGIALKSGNINQAQFAFSEAYKNTPWEGEIFLQQIRIKTIQKKYRLAITLADELLHKQPYSLTARLLRAQANSILGDQEASKTDIRFILNHMPYLPGAEEYRKWADEP